MSLLKPLTKREVLISGGSKITSMGSQRKIKMNKIISDSLGSSSVEQVAHRLKKEVGSRSDKKRDWVNVAITEKTNAQSKASLDLIESVFGPEAKVYRKANPKCCPQCLFAFGNPKKPKIFTISKIPDKLRFAVHPRCVCGPWKAIEVPDLTKSMNDASSYDLGAVVNDNGILMISVGSFFASIDSVVGKAMIKYVLLNTPLVKIGEQEGFDMFRHGTVMKNDFKNEIPSKIQVCDIMNISDLRFYKSNTELDVLKTKTFDDYLSWTMEMIPHVAAMPEMWSKESIRYVNDFLAFKTITDWVIAAPHRDRSMKTLKINDAPRKIIKKYVVKKLEGLA